MIEEERDKQNWSTPSTQLADRPFSEARQHVILVADDEALVRNLVALQMRQEGHFVLTSADGHEGLQRSRQHGGPIDLVTTDVEMPRLNGADLCTHLLEERPGIKVLVMSGADMSDIVSEYVDWQYLPKPFDGQILKARVRAILAGPLRPPIPLPSSDSRPQS
jgi:DNA-binding response OmpR family regulator